ncbi:MAG: diguanylate cyclase [Sideroxyarcus sp.]
MNERDTSSAGMQAEIERLNKIIKALMDRAERGVSMQGSDFHLFQTDVVLEDLVHRRTKELEAALLENEKITRALRESESHNRLLVENSPMCIHEIGMDGRITSMNRSGLLMMGLKEECEIQGYRYLDAVGDADREHIAALMDKAYGGESSHFEFNASGTGGQIYKSCFVPIKDKNGHIEKLMGITEDITLRKQLERQLTERETLFRAIFEQADSGIELIDPDTLRFVEVNPATCRMLGYAREEMLQMRLEDTQVDLDHAALMASVQQTETAGGAVFENRHRCKNGDILDVEINAHVLNLSGRHLIVALWRDVTGQKRAQEEIRFKNTILQTQQETSPDAILVVDGNAQIISYNRQFIDLWRVPPELVSAHQDGPVLQSVVEQVEEPEAFFARVQYLYAHRDAKSREELRLKDGRIIDRYSAPATDADGRYYGRVWYFRDITERRKAEEQVRNLAFYDTLTQLANRRLLEDRLRQAMVAGKRNRRYGAVMFLDLDNFKPLNDMHGHDVGDLLLIEVAQRITRCVRGMDAVARFGGDEFVVMLSELDVDRKLSMAQAGIVAEKIRIALAEPYLLERKYCDLADPEHGAENAGVTVEHHCTASIGVALFIGLSATQEDVIKMADAAMYQAKQAGRNRVNFSG